MTKSILLYCLLFFGFYNLSVAQNDEINQEVGIMVGPVFFQSDYGESDLFKNYYKNNGISIGGFYYVSAIKQAKSLAEYLKLRLEASYMRSNLNHYGRWVDPSRTGISADQLRAMSGSVQTINLGFQMEFYPFKTDDYNRYKLFHPYVSLGAQMSNYTSKVTSSLGPLGTAATTPKKYLGAYKNESGIVASLTASIGTRYMLNSSNALVLDARVQFYGSDWVDGINPDSNIYPENKSNDWSTTINFGYVYYFD